MFFDTTPFICLREVIYIGVLSVLYIHRWLIRDYIYIGDCTFVQVDENGTPIGDPVVLDEENCDNYVIGGNYSGPDDTWDPNIDTTVDIFGEGSIFDTTKDQTPTEKSISFETNSILIKDISVENKKSRNIIKSNNLTLPTI